MNVGQLPTPDTILSAFLAFLGIPPGIIAMVVLANWLRNWEETAKNTIEHARSLRRFAARTRTLPPVRIVSAVAVTVLIPCAQLLLLGLWYLIGQGLWLWLDPARGWDIETEIRREGYARIFRLAALGQLLPMNTIAGICLAVCFGTLIIAYGRAVAGRSVDKIATAIAAAGSVLLTAALTAITIYGLVKPSALTDSQLSAGVQPSASKAWLEMLSIPAIGLAVILGQTACQVSVRGTKLMVHAWSEDNNSGLTGWELFGRRIAWRRFIGGHL